MSEFKDFQLRLVSPQFDNPLMDTIIELERLRHLKLGGSTPAIIFFQLKNVFHLLESLQSARIEGNRTTLSEYVDTKIIAKPVEASDAIKEIANIEKAMDYIDEHMQVGAPITHTLIKELHSLAVTGLVREGDTTPGKYRDRGVTISQSDHVPPEAIKVQDYMDELVSFINEEVPSKYALLKVALIHHRFAWVHPFKNGNGRVVRLLTYALLIKYGFNVSQGRILNPAAIFCESRDAYYSMLSEADKGTDEGLLTWSAYVLEGILSELNKLDKLLDYSYLRTKILVPAINFSRERKIITAEEYAVLRMAIDKKEFTAQDVDTVLPDITKRQRAYLITKMVGNDLLIRKPNTYIYAVNVSSGGLMRGLMRTLSDEKFIPFDE